MNIKLYKPILFNPKGELKDEQIFICHQLIRKNIMFNSYDSELNDSDWTRLSSKQFQIGISAKNIYRTKQILFNNKILECNNTYYHGNKNSYCLGYRFLDKYNKCDWHEIKLTNKRMIRSIRESRNKQYNEPTTQIDRHFKQFFRKTEINYNDPIININPSQIESVKWWEKSKKDPKTYSWFHRCVFGNRLHYNGTSLWTPLRGCLTYENQTLVNVDIKNSQMVFFAILIQNILEKNTKYIQYNTSIDTYPHIITNINRVITSPSTIRLSKEVSKFVLKVEAGTIYDDILASYFTTLVEEIRCDKKEPYTYEKAYKEARNKIKKDLLTYFFCSNQIIKQLPIHNILKREYPTICKIIYELKRFNHKLLSMILQKMESRFVLDTVGVRIMKDYPSLFILPLHDSLLCVSGSEKLVYDIFISEFKKIQLNPKLKIEKYENFNTTKIKV